MLLIDSLSKQYIYQFKSFLKNSNIYSITIDKKDSKKKILFKCSYKILPLSLKKIAIGFSLENKMVFPYKFVSKETIFYVGKNPDFFFFETINDYNTFNNQNSFFDVEKYSIKYCMNDVKITAKFLKKLSKLINVSKISINDVYSAPSLSFKIFSKCFNMKNISFKLPKLLTTINKSAYCGGRCEVYGNPKDQEQIFHFDFSGMYSQCMQQKFCFGSHKIVDKNINIERPGYY
jgi:hypothetical protein